MASITGGLFHANPPSTVQAGPSATSSDAGRLSLASITGPQSTISGAGGHDTVAGSGSDTVGGTPTIRSHTTIAGSSSSPTVAGGGHDMVAGSGSDTVGSGFDTVSGPEQGSVRFAGGTTAGTEQVVATQSQSGSNIILHLPDGSTITLVGVTHFDATFIH
jgi:hypothetical protein